MQEYFVKLVTFVGQPQIVLGAGAAGIAEVQEQAEGVRAVAISQEAYEGDESALIAGIRLGIWDQVKALRQSAIAAGVSTPAGGFQTDRESVTNILGGALAALIKVVGDNNAGVGADPDIAVALAMLGQAFPLQWTLTNNTDADLTPGATVRAGVSAFVHVITAHARSRALWNEIESAETPVALLQIDITAGWPGAQGGQ